MPLDGFKTLFALVIMLSLFPRITLRAEQVPVRHMEGTSLGFLVLRTLDGTPIAYGGLKQVPQEGYLMDDLKFTFKDGSFYEEITKFTERGEFRLLSDQVVQKGPAFKQQMESWIDATAGKVTIRLLDKGKEKLITKNLTLPSDVANGLLFILTKNIDPSARETAVSMVAVSKSPRVVKIHIFPSEGKSFSVGTLSYQAQHYVIKIEIGGVAGTVASLTRKKPADLHMWLLKSEAPTFVEFQGQLSPDAAVWRIELAAPEPDSPGNAKK